MGGRGGGVLHGPEETTGHKTEPSLMTFAVKERKSSQWKMAVKARGRMGDHDFPEID